MHKVTIGIVAVTVLTVGTLFASESAQEETQKKAVAKQEQKQETEKPEMTPFMKRKLDTSRDIVSGLASEDFTLIAKSAQELMLLSHEADWKRFTTKEYLKLSNEFRSSASRLRDGAEAKNVDGSTLAYFEVTLNCVRCHKYMRAQDSK